jgi:hypothetical protein
MRHRPHNRLPRTVRDSLAKISAHKRFQAVNGARFYALNVRFREAHGAASGQLRSLTASK